MLPTKVSVILVATVFISFLLVLFLNSKTENQFLAPKMLNLHSQNKSKVSNGLYGKSKRKKKSKIIINYIGRLGNRMFQYATLYGISRTLGMIPVIKKDNTIQKVFGKLRATVVNDSFSTNGFQVINLSPPCGFDPRAYTLDTSKDTKLSGYACAWPYFHPQFAEDIRQQFTAREHIRRKALKFLEKARQGRHNAVIVGIHVRRGDFLAKDKINYGYVVAPRQYFVRAMEYFRKRYPNVVFVVCSNGIEWCKNNINCSMENPVYFSENNSPEVDMAILGNCNHTIISVGSFGWWGAYLSNGEVVYYKHQINETCPLGKYYVLRDFVIPNGKAME